VKTHKVACYLLGLVTLLALAAVVSSRAQEDLWKAEIRRLSERLAYLDAQSDMAKGRKRLLQLDGDNAQLRFSGQYEGSFEIWLPRYHPSISLPYRYAEEQYVHHYNVLRRTIEQPSTKRTAPRTQDQESGGGAQPDGAANGSQPTRSETNRTSSTAGSRR
jgi:hypothetical protein